MIDINIDELRKDLIQIYQKYINEDTKQEAIEKAKDLDSIWSGAFVLPVDIEEAILCLRYMYLQPSLTNIEAEMYLKKLLEE